MSKILIFEGLDCSGKTTVRNEILKTTNEYVIWDRGFASQWVYGKLLNRTDTPKGSELLVMERQLIKYAVYIYFVAHKKDIMQRCFEKKEDPNLYTEEFIDICTNLYETYFEFSNLRRFVVNTSFRNSEQCALDVINYLERIKKEG